MAFFAGTWSESAKKSNDPKFFLKVKNVAAESGDRMLKSLHVSGVFHRYLELRECKPRLSKLRTILAENPFSGLGNLASRCRFRQSVEAKSVTFCRFFDIKKYVYLNCHSCLVLF
jgi:hypothetical protein